VDVDLDAAADHGIKPGEIRRSVATIVGGEEVGDIFRDGQAYDVQVWSIPEARHSVDAIERLLVDTPSGEQVPLSELAEVTIEPLDNTVERENQSRRLDVSANIDGRDLGTVARDVEEVVAGIAMPLGFSSEVIGEFQERQESQAALLRFSLIAFAVVLGLLYTSVGSWRLATLAAICLPTAMVGGILAASLTGGVLSLGSLVGFLTVLGIATRNGIMMINHFQHLENEEGMEFGLDLVVRGAEERLAPILMTALTTGLALVPLVWAGNIAGHEIEHPMAIVILGGLVTSTFLNLFVIPPLYLRFARPVDRSRGVKPGLTAPEPLIDLRDAVKDVALETAGASRANTIGEA
jgi:Cu/Ag efflux pump CusA